MKIVTIIIALSTVISFRAAAEDSSKSLRVGAILPLTGMAATWGGKVLAGLETAIRVHGAPFVVKVEDEGSCEVPKALAAYRKLTSVDKVDIFFLGCLAGTKAIAPIAARERVVLFSLGLLDKEALSTKANVINLATQIGTEGKALADYVIREKTSKIAGLFFSDAFGQEFARVLSDQLAAAGRPLQFRDEAGADTVSFRSIITRWKNSGVDLVITTISDKHAVTLLREMKELGYKPKIYSSYVLESVGPEPENRALFEGIKYTYPVSAEIRQEDKSKFEGELQKHLPKGELPIVNNYFAYDGIELLMRALNECPDRTTLCIADSFRKLGTYFGISGEMQFEKTGGLVRPYGLKTVDKGQFVWLDSPRKG